MSSRTRCHECNDRTGAVTVQAASVGVAGAAPRPVRRLTLRRAIGALVAIAAAALTVQVLVNSRGELLAAADDLTAVSPGWLVVAVLAELLSYGCLAAAQHRLLTTGGVQVGLAPLTALAIAAQAGANCLPGGVAVSTAVAFRRLSRRGVPTALCGWMLSISTLLYAAALGVLALLGAQVAGDASAAVPDLRPVSLAVVGVVGVSALVLVALRDRHLPSRLLGWVVTCADTLLAAVRHRPAHPAGTGPGVIWVQQLRAVRPGPGRLLTVSALLVGCWLADGLCLALAFYALGGGPPWRGLLLAYCAAQLAASLPITPGGLGVVEGSLTVALVAYGGAEQSALAAVLPYRLISFWGLIPVGALAYLGLRRTERRPSGPSAATQTGQGGQ